MMSEEKSPVSVSPLELPPPSLPDNIHVHFEDELASDLEKDDVLVLEKRFNVISNLKKVTSMIDRKSIGKVVKKQTQWTRALDAVQEHFSSHVTLDSTSYRLPHKLYALKLAAKHSFILYKKRECERRKRIRRQIEKEKKKASQGNPANILLSMVDACESCKRLYVTVNLFWGKTFCDACYFNPEVLQKVMDEMNDVASKKLEITPDNVVQEAINLRNSNKNSYFFDLSVEKPPPIPRKKRDLATISSPLSQSPDILVDLSPITLPTSSSSSSSSSSDNEKTPPSSASSSTSDDDDDEDQIIEIGGSEDEGDSNNEEDDEISVVRTKSQQPSQNGESSQLSSQFMKGFFSDFPSQIPTPTAFMSQMSQGWSQVRDDEVLFEVDELPETPPLYLPPLNSAGTQQ